MKENSRADEVSPYADMVKRLHPDRVTDTDQAMAAPATLSLRRAASSSLGFNSQQPFRVILNGEAAGEIRPGETFVVSATPGEHRLAVRCQRYGSREVRFAAREGQRLYFGCQARSPLDAVGVFALAFRSSRYLLLWRIS